MCPHSPTQLGQTIGFYELKDSSQWRHISHWNITWSQLVIMKEGQTGEESKKNNQVLDYLLLLPLVVQGPVPWYPLLHLAELVFYPSVQVEQPGPQRTRFLGVLQVQGGRHDPQRLEQARLD